MVEIAELKSLSPHTLHQAVALFDSYLLARQVDRSALQLLGVTAILVASRFVHISLIILFLCVQARNTLNQGYHTCSCRSYAQHSCDY